MRTTCTNESLRSYFLLVTWTIQILDTAKTVNVQTFFQLSFRTVLPCKPVIKRLRLVWINRTGNRTAHTKSD
jgi:hypothetical protein